MNNRNLCGKMKNRKFCLVEIWEGVDHEANTKMQVKVQNDIIMYINIQISPIFNFVTPDSISLASLTHQNTSKQWGFFIKSVYYVGSEKKLKLYSS